MPIQGNEAIFSLLETRYGGDGYKDFALPKVPNLGNARYIICVKGDFPSRS
ncbi:tail fiber protein [Runella sp. SP2]|uniref:tail fiber protein n=1 Tax=Runella sp. SP2 TaxID=2268026 RepID=UPI0013DE5A48|nr:tail fiber protein [Runella sp. SP2]